MKLEVDPILCVTSFFMSLNKQISLYDNIFVIAK